MRGTDLTVVLHVQHSGRRSEYHASDLPLAMGLSGHGELVIGGTRGATATAWLGEQFGQIFIQPQSGAEAPRHNGVALDSSAWVTSGDEIEIGGTRITVEDDAGVILLNISDEPGVPVLMPPDQGPEVKAREERSRVPEHLPPPSEPGFLPVQRGHTGVRNLLIGIFVLLAIGVTFVLVAAPVRVAVTPEPDRISLEGFPPPIPIGGPPMVLSGAAGGLCRVSGESRIP